MPYMPVDFISAVLEAAESSKGPDSFRELSTTPIAEELRSRAGTTGKAYVIEYSSG